LREASILDVFRVDIIAVPDIIVNNSDFQWESDSVGSDNESLVVNTNEVNNKIRFGIFERLVEIYGMFT